MQSLSYSFLHFLHPVYIWLETKFGTVQKLSLRPLLDSPKCGLNIGILLYYKFERIPSLNNSWARTCRNLVGQSSKILSITKFSSTLVCLDLKRRYLAQTGRLTGLITYWLKVWLIERMKSCTCILDSLTNSLTQWFSGWLPLSLRYSICQLNSQINANYYKNPN